MIFKLFELIYVMDFYQIDFFNYWSTLKFTLDEDVTSKLAFKITPFRWHDYGRKSQGHVRRNPGKTP